MGAAVGREMRSGGMIGDRNFGGSGFVTLVRGRDHHGRLRRPHTDSLRKSQPLPRDPVLSHDTRHCRLADVVEPRHISAGLTASDNALGSLLRFGIILLASPSDSSLSAGSGNAC
jgi:hypothetical protein